jgi:hypothetical protein
MPVIPLIFRYGKLSPPREGRADRIAKHVLLFTLVPQTDTAATLKKEL